MRENNYLCRMKAPHHIEVERTADGSYTLYLKEIDEHYHSVKGAISESNHIYRDCAFLYRSNGKLLRLLEIGLGTGLNATVTAMTADASHPVHYIALEKYPLSQNILTALDYSSLIDAKLFDAIHAAPWEQATAITPYFTIEKRKCDYLTDALPQGIDIVYFDAFAPEKQPEMWTEEAFTRLYNSLNKNAILTTYCAKGNIRRLLSHIGFMVERIAGPCNGKREILRASK